MTTHVVVQDDEPYIGTGDRPMCDYCYDIAEEEVVNLTPLNMTICVKLTVDMYIKYMYKVLSTSIYGGSMEFDFDTLHEAQLKVRELKDHDHRDAFIVRLITVNS